MASLLASGLGGLWWIVYVTWKFADPWLILTSVGPWHRSFAPFPLVVSYQITALLAQLRPEVVNNLASLVLWLLPFMLDLCLISLAVMITLKYSHLLPTQLRIFLIVYCLLVASLPVFSLDHLGRIPAPTLSLVRYVMICFPLFVVLAKRFEKNFLWLLVPSIGLQSLYGVYYVLGYYIP
jgi:hypothetical protein